MTDQAHNPEIELSEVSLADIPLDELDMPLSQLFASEETDAEPVTGCNCIGPEAAEWRRVRALELAISAGGYSGPDVLLATARQIETFLKG